MVKVTGKTLMRLGFLIEMNAVLVTAFGVFLSIVGGRGSSIVLFGNLLFIIGYGISSMGLVSFVGEPNERLTVKLGGEKNG